MTKDRTTWFTRSRARKTADALSASEAEVAQQLASSDDALNPGIDLPPVAHIPAANDAGPNGEPASDATRTPTPSATADLGDLSEAAYAESALESAARPEPDSTRTPEHSHGGQELTPQPADLSPATVAGSPRDQPDEPAPEASRTEIASAASTPDPPHAETSNPPGAPVPVPIANSNDVESDGSERRRWPRIRLNLQVRLRFGSVHAVRRSRTFDVSPGGAFIQLPDPRPVGTGVRLVLEIADHKMVVSGVIVRVVPPDTRSGPVGVGVVFKNLSAEDTRFLEELVTSEDAVLAD